MATTYDAAYTEITNRFIAEWTAGAPAIVGTVPEIRFAGVEKPEVPTVTFGRFVMNPVSAPQATQRNGEFGMRYEHNGIIIVQLLIRRNRVDAEEIARKLAMLVQRIFRDPRFPGCYIFRNVRINNLEPEDSFLRKNVVMEYQFDELT